MVWGEWSGGDRDDGKGASCDGKGWVVMGGVGRVEWGGGRDDGLGASCDGKGCVVMGGVGRVVWGGVGRVGIVEWGAV